MSKITYTDKVTLNENPNVADVNKVKADDLNEIKNVVNANDDYVGDLADLKTPDVSSIVNAINELLGDLGNNYIKLSNGILIMWGTTDVGNISPSNEKRITINLPQNYIDTNYSCIVSKKGTGAYWSNISETIADKNNSSVTLSVWNNSNAQATIPGMYYITIGKWK